ncbi:hypothetical protein D9M68_952930 [compost metagenome]
MLTRCSSVIMSASPAMISTGALRFLTSSPQDSGSCSRAIMRSTNGRKPSGLGAYCFQASSIGEPMNISGAMVGIMSRKAGWEPDMS